MLAFCAWVIEGIDDLDLDARFLYLLQGFGEEGWCVVRVSYQLFLQRLDICGWECDHTDLLMIVVYCCRLVMGLDGKGVILPC